MANPIVTVWVLRLLMGEISRAVTQDIHHDTSRASHEEAADAPRFIGQWIDNSVPGSQGCTMDGIHILDFHR